MNPGLNVMIGAASLLLASTAGAAEPAPLTSATAIWTENGQVELNVAYEGSACEETQQPTVTASEIFGTDVVTIPTVETAEVCTMQLVPVEFEGTIAVEPTTDMLSVVVLDAEGQPQAAGSVPVSKSGGSKGG